MASRNNIVGFQSRQFTSTNIEELKSILHLGDRLDFSFIYGIEEDAELWLRGIYVGRYEDMEHAVLMHVSQEPEIRAKEISLIMEEYNGDDPFYVMINNSKDIEVSPLHPDFIIKVAKIMHRSGAPMVEQFLNSNPERFQDLCRNDIYWSNRVFAQYSFRRVSDFPYTSANIEDLEDKVCPGDRLEFPRKLPYAHWGIYVGPYKNMRHSVIHFGVAAFGIASSVSVSVNTDSEIRADTIGTVIGSDEVRINNSRDNDRNPLSPYVISYRAKGMHQKKDQTPIKYNLLSSNCEHFVNLCRYDEPYSEQAIFLSIVIVVAIVLVLIMKRNIQRK